MPDIRGALDADDVMTTRLVAHFETLGDRDVEVVLPDVESLPSQLLRLAVPHDDIDPLVALRPRMSQPGEQWLLRHCVGHLADAMGTVDGEHWDDGMLDLPRLRELDGCGDPLVRYFYVFVYLAARPLIEDFHQRRGIDPAITWATLADLGRNMAIHRVRHPGVGGFEDYHWLSLHHIGALYALGRLQFQRVRLRGTRTAASIAAAGLDVADGERVLSIHIPRFHGPLTPALVDTALLRAREFFAAHFPDERYRYAVCKSWLLDPQFGAYLPERPNVLGFARRFTVASVPEVDDDAGTLQFAFADSTRPRSELPRDSSIQRAILDHLDSGRHWYGATGWLEL